MKDRLDENRHMLMPILCKFVNAVIIAT